MPDEQIPGDRDADVGSGQGSRSARPHASGPEPWPDDYSGQGDGPPGAWSAEHPVDPADPNLPTGFYGAETDPGDLQGRGSPVGLIVSALAVVLLLAGVGVVLMLTGGEDAAGDTDQVQQGPATPRRSLPSVPPATGLDIPTAAPAVRPADRSRLQSVVSSFVADARAGRCAAAWARLGEVGREEVFHDRQVFCRHVLPGIAGLPSPDRCTFEQVVTPTIECTYGPDSIHASLEVRGGAPMIDFVSVGEV